MQDPALALVAICGFSVICIGLVAVLGFLVLRFTGRSISGMLGGGGLHGLFTSLSGADDPDDEPGIVNRRRRIRTTPAATDLRAQAQSLDFDAAVNQYKNQPLRPSSTGTPSPFPPIQTQSLTQPEPDNTTSSRRRRRRSPDEEAEADDMFGGFLDEIDPF